MKKWYQTSNFEHIGGNPYPERNWVTQGLFQLGAELDKATNIIQLRGVVIDSELVRQFEKNFPNFIKVLVRHGLHRPNDNKPSVAKKLERIIGSSSLASLCRVDATDELSDSSKEKIEEDEITYVDNVTNTMVYIDVSTSGGGCVEIISLNLEFFQLVVQWFRQNVQTKKEKGRVYTMIQSQDGFQFKSVGTAGIPLETSNYTAEVNKEYQHVCEDLQSPTPCGRIVILNGDPGTGKSYLVRGLLEDCEKCIFILVQPTLIQSLGGPSMIDSLIELQGRRRKPIVFIVEDADTVMMERGTDNMNAVAALLNFGDGILSSMLDVRIITTTNARVEDLDAAIVRPGRLCRRIDIGRLSADQAKSVYLKLTGKELASISPKGATLAEIYRLARQDGWTPPPPPSGLGFCLGDDDDR